jgi:DNA-binding CsgD family transcriptional regulator
VRTRPALIAREAERQRVDAFCAAVPGGPRTFLVRGEPGIGKSALWQHGLERCRAAGFEVLVARPAPEEMTLALSCLHDLFEPVDGARPLDAALDEVTRGRAVLSTLRDLAAAGPTVLAIDDVQWLDAASASALRYALRRLQDEPVGVLATARSEACVTALPERTPTSWYAEVELGPLDRESLRRVLAGYVDAISRPALTWIHAVSAGNPLYAIELARLQADGFAAGGPLPLPQSLKAAVEQRLDSVAPEVATLLETVAANGATRVDELPREPLEQATQDGLLVIGEDLRVRFQHPLVASTVYARTGPLERHALHAALALKASEPDVRARHLALSTVDPDEDVARELEEAATRANAAGASALAAEFAGHAVRLTPAGAPERARRAGLEIDGLAAAGEAGRALALADQLLGELPPGPARAEALLRRALLEDDDRATAESLLLRVLDDAADVPGLRARALIRLGHLRVVDAGQMRTAVARVSEALELADQSGDEQLQLYAASRLGHLQALSGAPRPELMARAVELEQRLGSPRMFSGPRLLLGKQLLYGGDLEASRRLLHELHDESVRSGNEFVRPRCLYDLALVECAAGDLEAAGRCVEQGLEAVRDARYTDLERLLLYPLALVQAWRGNAGEARSAATELLQRAQRRGGSIGQALARRVLGQLALACGDAEGAASELGEAARILDEVGIAHPGAFPVLADAAEALACAGNRDDAGRLLLRLQSQAAACSSRWAAASALRARGALLLAGGQPGEAIEPLTEALEVLDELGHRPEAARAALVLGRALLRDGRRARAGEAFADAERRFSRIGAALWRERAAEELERAAPGRTAGELTAAERRVAALVAQGRRNRQIAQTLFMSVATVEAHLTRTYRKLRIGSRSDLARLVADGSLNLND